MIALADKWRSSTKQLSNTSHFANDLGLDSLDTVEVVMAIEEVRWKKYRFWKLWELTCAKEFSIEIPDKEADAIHSSECRFGHVDDELSINHH